MSPQARLENRAASRRFRSAVTGRANRTNKPCPFLSPAGRLIYLLRHGQTEFNREGRLQGRLDSPLTELGLEQARRMGGVVRRMVDDPRRWTLVSSPLGRARRTAELVLEASGLPGPIAFDERLSEIDVGAWEGLDRGQIEAVAPGVIGTPGWLLTAPGGETYAMAAARLGAWLAEVDEADGRRRLVVCHGVAGRILRGLYTGLGLDEVWSAPSPPQDAVFRLHGGAALRIDDGADRD